MSVNKVSLIQISPYGPDDTGFLNDIHFLRTRNDTWTHLGVSFTVRRCSWASVMLIDLQWVQEHL